MAGQSAQKRLSTSQDIPDRLYFRIGEVGRICGVEPYVLRFWETQFPNLKPNKGGTGQRLYRRREVELALQIKYLVYEQGYTLAGAKQALASAPRMKRNQGVLKLNESPSQHGLETATAAIGKVRAELRDLLRQLSIEQPTIRRRRSRLTTLNPSQDQAFPF